MFRIGLYFLIAFSFAAAIFDFVCAVQYANRGLGWVAYFIVFGLVMLACGVVNSITLSDDIRSEREHKDWLEKFEIR